VCRQLARVGKLAFWVVIYFPLFYRLDALPLQQWDEARRAVNAAEMWERGSWLVAWYGDQPEMWGTKPPLLLWLQVLLIGWLGYDELAIRLPAALSGLGTIALLVWFAERQLKKPIIGYWAGIILVGMPWCGFHITRTGDFDALLSLWHTAAILFSWLWIEALQRGHPHKHWDILSGVATGLAALTKGMAGFFYLPGMVLMALWRGQLQMVWRNRTTWIAAACAFGPLLFYYFLREQLTPGYLMAVWQNELGGRFSQPLEDHTGPFTFYFDVLGPWLWPLPIALWLGFRQKKWRSLLSFLLGCSAVFLLIISAAGTKLPWYAAPLYPPIALMLSIGLKAFAERLQKLWQPQRHAAIMAHVAASLLLVPAYVTKVQQVAHPHHQNPWEAPQLDYGPFMELMKDHKRYYLFQKGYNAALRFYEKAWRQRGYQVTRLYDLRTLQSGDLLMTCDETAFSQLQKREKAGVRSDDGKDAACCALNKAHTPYSITTFSQNRSEQPQCQHTRSDVARQAYGRYVIDQRWNTRQHQKRGTQNQCCYKHSQHQSVGDQIQLLI